jgi:hypothetical protein
MITCACVELHSFISECCTLYKMQCLARVIKMLVILRVQSSTHSILFLLFPLTFKVMFNYLFYLKY